MHPYIPHLLEDILAAYQRTQLNVPDVKSLEDIIEGSQPYRDNIKNRLKRK